MPRHSPLVAAVASVAFAAVPAPAGLPNGVAAGDVTPTSAYLWSRSDSGSPVAFQLSTDPTFAAGVTSFAPAASGDPLLPTKVFADGLSAGTRYYYRASDGSQTTAGTFKTAAAAGQQTGLRFAVTGDWRGELAPYPAIKNVPTDGSLDFFVELGDTIYSDFPTPAVPAGQARTLGEFRAKHAEVYGDRGGASPAIAPANNYWAQIRGSTAVYATLDDHEVTNDFAGYATVGQAGAPFTGNPSARVNDSELHNNGTQVFHEYNPIAEEFYAGPDDDSRMSGERKVYRNRSFGKDAAMIVLDNRSFRDAEAANPLNYFDATRTMLGGQQLADLKADLSAAQAAGTTWKFVVTAEPIQQIGATLAADRYEGYFAERNDILKYVDDNKIDNVVFVSADIHGTLVNNLQWFDNPATPGNQGMAHETGAFEITTGSVGFNPPFGQTILGGVATGLLPLPPGTPPALGQALTDLATRAGNGTELQQNAVVQLLLAAAYAGDPLFNPDPVGIEGGRGINVTVEDAQFVLPDTLFSSLGLDPTTQAILEAAGLTDDFGFSTAFAATTYFGWSDFEIDPITQELVITTYGIAPYTQTQIEDDPSVLARDPAVLSRLRFAPIPEPATTGLVVVSTLGPLTRRRRAA